MTLLIHDTALLESMMCLFANVILLTVLCWKLRINAWSWTFVIKLRGYLHLLDLLNVFEHRLYNYKWTQVAILTTLLKSMEYRNVCLPNLVACRRCLWMETTSARCLTSWVDWPSSTAWGSPLTISLTSLLCWRDWVQWTS